MPNDLKLEIARLRQALMLARGRLLMLSPQAPTDDIDQVLLDSVMAEHELDHVNVPNDRVATRNEKVDAAAMAAAFDDGAQRQNPPRAPGAQNHVNDKTDAQAAACWRTLTGAAYIKTVGWIQDRDSGRLLHLGLELWTRHPESGHNEAALEKLEEFIEAVRYEDRDCRDIADAWREKIQKAVQARPTIQGKTA
jgi:hypothetical protein